MKKIEEYLGVIKIIHNSSLWVVYENYIYIYDKQDYLYLKEKINTIRYLLFTNEENDLYSIDELTLKIKFIGAGYALEAALFMSNYIYIPQKNNGKYDFIILNKNLIEYKKAIWPLNFTYLDSLYHYDNIIIKKYDFYQNQNVWQTDISSYGKCLNLRDEQQPNEIDGDLMGYENLLFVPLRGGQLLALDVETGEKVWILEQEISGQYAIFQDKIYKKNRFLYEIDARTGIIMRQKDIEDGSIPDSFMAIGPIWVYDDVIVLINNYKGDIVILNRDNFSVYDKINIGAAMTHSKDSVIWHNNKLYVLDLTSTLHIFERV